MKKCMITGLLMSTILLGMGIQTHAEVTKIEDNEYESEAKVVIETNSSPTNPEKPNEPNDGTTGQNGPLSLDNIIHFDFGRTTVKGVKDIKPLETKEAQNVQITDNRGTGNGWKLQVKQSELKDNEKVLKGAAIIMGEGDVIGHPESTVAEPTLSTIKLTDTDQVIMTAEKDAGMGTWLGEFNTNETNKQIQLEIPSNALIGNYVGAVTWTLTDGPTV